MTDNSPPAAVSKRKPSQAQRWRERCVKALGDLDRFKAAATEQLAAAHAATADVEQQLADLRQLNAERLEVLVELEQQNTQLRTRLARAEQQISSGPINLLLAQLLGERRQLMQRIERLAAQSSPRAKLQNLWNKHPCPQNENSISREIESAPPYFDLDKTGNWRPRMRRLLQRAVITLL